MRTILFLAALASCQGGGPNPNDVTGPFTGPVRRFVVDRFVLPTMMGDTRRLGDDLDGDGLVDNVLGGDLEFLAELNDVPVDSANMIAAGSLVSSLTLQADDLLDDPTVQAAFFGADGEPATPVGGKLVDGAFHSNRTATTDVPGAATLHLPAFADADITIVPLDKMELDLTPDGTGGYDAMIRGGIAPDQLGPQVTQGLDQMIAFAPASHRELAELEDANRDGSIEPSEISQFILPDVTLHGRALVSLGFAVHLAPCDAGSCQTAPPVDRCHDRVRDGSETDVDCGGPCAPCPGGKVCAVAADCATGACNGNVCDAPTCSDGRMDGLETDVDCGWSCAPCARGQHCFSDKDCTPGDLCANHTSPLGLCTAP